MNRRVLGNAMQKFFEQRLPRAVKVGLARIPDEHDDQLWAILYPLNTAQPDGDWADPARMGWYLFQMTCVGRTHDQCAGLSDSVWDTFLGRDGSGRYKHSIVIGGPPAITVIERREDGRGVVARSAGENYYQCADGYRMYVSAG